MNIEIISEWDDAPQYATSGSAAIDLRASLADDVAPGVRHIHQVIPAGGCATIGTGVRLHIKDTNVAGVILPRSGLGSRGLVLGNLVGLIDSDYQGEIKLCMWNRGDEPCNVIHGERITQMVFVHIARPTFTQVWAFSGQSERGEGGFGHTGVE